MSNSIFTKKEENPFIRNVFQIKKLFFFDFFLFILNLYLIVFLQKKKEVLL
jgi:hypothetical protein